MANSSIVGKAKNIIIKEFIKDIDIVRAIGDEEITSLEGSEKLVNKRIFNYHQNPNYKNPDELFRALDLILHRKHY